MAGPVKDREAFQRLSFLYQAAHCVLAQDPMNQALARFYCYTERTIAKRLVLRRDPSVKRTLCRGCSSLLIPGLTCTQRQRRCRGQRWTVQTCLTCQRSQRFLNDPDHLLWGDRPEAQLGSQAVIYTEHGTRSYNPKIKSHMLLRLSRPVNMHEHIHFGIICCNTGNDTMSISTRPNKLVRPDDNNTMQL
ncbi:ribonuclease P protein subunit p21 isoform X1 [Lontra canadensis]|uniref:ribonuclease P protein subunit p21 isoform X1 n=1 Tax=Lontra canadensis TaxID=76717 RepID=UPI0013F2E74E|nr:ribonuclease P protein subunit p21 isoform X1 [Lontra canadensis]